MHPSRRFVRPINPIHAGTEQEVETALGTRRKVLMLPNFRSADEAAAFSAQVRGPGPREHSY